MDGRSLPYSKSNRTARHDTSSNDKLGPGNIYSNSLAEELVHSNLTKRQWSNDDTTINTFGTGGSCIRHMQLALITPVVAPIPFLRTRHFTGKTNTTSLRKRQPSGLLWFVHPRGRPHQRLHRRAVVSNTNDNKHNPSNQQLHKQEVKGV